MKRQLTKPHWLNFVNFSGFWALVFSLLACGPMELARAQVPGGSTGWGWCAICGADFPNIEQHMLMHRQSPSTNEDGTSGGAESQYSVVTIYNRTPQAITCLIQSRRWGSWQRTTIQSGGYYYRWQSAPASFKLRLSDGTFGGRTWTLEHYTVTGREPTAQDGRPYFITGTGKELTVTGGNGASTTQEKPKLATTPCQCGGASCRCLWDSCGAKGARKCGCGGKDCTCKGLRCPKFANTTQCTGFTVWESDGRKHCNFSHSPSTSTFAGTWTGTIKLGITSKFSGSLKVSADGDSVMENESRALAHAATRNGPVLLWRSGILNEISWTLKPNPDGQTATVTATSPLGKTTTATFTKEQ